MPQICGIKPPKRFDYAIGDIQGCYDGLMYLLDKLKFDDHQDRLWFVGDLVNRGPSSLKVLRFIKNLATPPIITLGNHDLYLLSLIYLHDKYPRKKDTLSCILSADDTLEIGEWLRSQFIVYYDKELNIIMSHAGIAPIWGLDEAIMRGQELEQALQGPDFKSFLADMLGDTPNSWDDDLQGNLRLRLICNYFTRMRYCRQDGSLDLNYKGLVKKAPKGLSPWFNVQNRKPINAEIVFGHWASLGGNSNLPQIHAIDTGLVWGGALTALRLQDKKRISITWDEINF